MIHIERKFTKAGASVYDTCSWKKVHSKITEADGRIVFELKDAEFPEHYSQTACDIVSSKYFRRAGVPASRHRVQEENVHKAFQRFEPDEKTTFGSEISLKQCIDRMVGHWTYWAACCKIVDDLEAFSDELKYMILHQMWSPNSPQWFNCGLNWAYGIKPKDEGYYTIHGEYVSGCFEQMHACQPGYSSIHTTNGIETLQNVVSKVLKNEEVRVFDGDSFVKVIAAKNNGIKKVYRHFLSDGNRVDATEDHLFVLSDGSEVKSNDLVSGMKLIQKYNKNIPETKFDIDSYIIGQMLADGYCDQCESATSFTFELLYKSNNVRTTEINWIIKNNLSFNETETHWGGRLRGYGNEEFWNKLGVAHKSAITATIPDLIVSGGNNKITSVLAGLFDADGCLKGQAFRYTSVSENLAYQVFNLLRHIGIKSVIGYQDDIREDATRKRCFYISVSGQENKERFISLIPMINENKLNDVSIEESTKKSFYRPVIFVNKQELSDMEVFDIQTESGLYMCNGQVIHNCFIQPIEDQMFGEDGIFDILNNEARIFKKGSGTGTNFSNLRAKGERLSGGGKSSGVLSYLKIFDSSAGSIKSGGTTRRSAKMVILDLDHPDIEEFITWKSLEETKVASMITGSKLNKRYLDAIVLDPRNDKLKALALRRGIESNYIGRAVSLGDMGYKEFPMALITSDFNGEGYSTISGQNSNNTVSIPDAFFKCLESNMDWHLITRLPSKSQKNWVDPVDHPQGSIYVNGSNRSIKKNGKFYDIVKSLPSKQLMDLIAFNAWQSADPGVHFRTTINDWHTCLADGEIRSSNPCSEYLFLDNTACNLSSHRLTKHYDGRFNVETYKHAIRLSQIVLDLSVESALLPSKGIGEGTAKYRTTGNGYADIGAMLMKMGIAYDSETGRAWIAAMTSLLTSECYIVSKQLADIKGPYEAWERNKVHHMNVMTNHLFAAQLSDDINAMIDPDRLDYDLISEELGNAIKKSWSEAVDAPNGYRNAHVTVLAPTGTIGIQMDCDTTGIEPDFSLKKWKKLSGGGYLTMVNQAVPEALNALGYSKEQIDSIIAFYDGEKAYPGIEDEKIKSSMHVSQLGLPDVLQQKIYGHGTLKGSILDPEHLNIFDCANDISWKGHVLAMAAAQPFLSGSISKTINMPNHANVEDIKQAFILSHSRALKCNAIYRDGSKLSQPLNLKLDLSIATELPSIKDELNELFTSGRGNRNKPPARRAGWTDEFEVNGFKYYLRHNIDANNKLCELWIDAPNESSSVRTALNTMCRFMSKGLQYGMPVEEVVDTLTGIQQDPRGLVKHENIKVCKSIYDAIGRFVAYMYLGKTDMTDVESEMLIDNIQPSTVVTKLNKTTKECPRCSSTDITTPSSCKNSCKVCGYTWGGCGE